MTALFSPLETFSDDFTGYTTKLLFDEARSLSVHHHAVNYRLIAITREIERRGEFCGQPIKTAEWLHNVCGITQGSAREKVRTARALDTLPLIDEAFRTGALSYSKVRAVTRVANAENEKDLLEIARFADAHHVERIVKRYRQVERLGRVRVAA